GDTQHEAQGWVQPAGQHGGQHGDDDHDVQPINDAVRVNFAYQVFAIFELAGREIVCDRSTVHIGDGMDQSGTNYGSAAATLADAQQDGQTEQHDHADTLQWSQLLVHLTGVFIDHGGRPNQRTAPGHHVHDGG